MSSCSEQICLNVKVGTSPESVPATEQAGRMNDSFFEIMTSCSSPTATYTAIFECVRRLREIDFSGDAGPMAAYVEERMSCLLEMLNGNPGWTTEWAYLRIAAPPKQRFETIRRVVAPMVEHLSALFPVRGWWWLYKKDIRGSALRVRLHVPPDIRCDIERAAVTYAEGCGLETATLVYEPETCLFGGPEGMRIAHQFFCADSEFLSRWLALSGPEVRQAIPSGLSLSLIFHFLRSAGLDMFETWDVFDRVYAKRRRGLDRDDDHNPIENFAIKVIETGHAAISSAMPELQRNLTEKYSLALERLGQTLASAFYSGKLRCGMREFAVPLILFHWNRVGMDGAKQWALSRAVMRVLQVKSRSES